MSDGKHLDIHSDKPSLPDDGILRIFSMRFCPYAQRVHLVLNAKGIPYHSVFVNLSQKPKWLTEFSALGKVPALQLPKEDGQPSLIESLIIADYLDEKYPENTLSAKDPLQKAQDRILIERFSAVGVALYPIILGADTEKTTKCLNDISIALDVFEQELHKRQTKFFHGDKPGMLDYMIWPWFERLDMLKYLLANKFELDEKRFENLLKWRDLMIADPAVQGFYLDGETHAKFIKGRQEGNPPYNMLV